jgi:hypothetical protein
MYLNPSQAMSTINQLTSFSYFSDLTSSSCFSVNSSLNKQSHTRYMVEVTAILLLTIMVGNGIDFTERLRYTPIPRVL